MLPPSFSKLLLVIHAVAAIVTVGSATHNGVLAFLHFRGRHTRARLQRLYVRILLWSYLATFGLGLVLYPTFRIRVRGGYIDEHAPLATGFFEVKEHWLLLGLGILFAYYPLSRRIDVARRSPDATAYHLMGMLLMVIVWWAVLTGLAVNATRPL